MNPRRHSPQGTFRSLRHRNYRLWAAGALVSNIGTWVQRTALDWVVLTQLTANDATSVGLVMSLQFGPQLLLVSVAGTAADRFDRRHLLVATQVVMGLLALILGGLSLAGALTLPRVYALALAQGCASAMDTPARQAFVSDLVTESDIVNAVALNSMSFHGARLIGPAAAGLLLAGFGAGWAFLLNAASFGAVVAALLALRVDEIRVHPRHAPGASAFRQGLHYVWHHPDLRAAMLMMFLVSTFGLNFAIFVPTMSAEVFGLGPSGYGLLASLLGVGAVGGAVFSARQTHPRMGVVWITAAVFALGCTVCALAPGEALFGVALLVTGAASQIFMSSTNGLVQLSTAPSMRGRVMAIMMGIINGFTPLGAPLVGRVSDTLGPRWALGVAAGAAALAAVVGLRHRRMRQAGDPPAPPGGQGAPAA